MALIIVTILCAEGIAQTCNPAIDGTYGAEQMGKRPSGAVTTPKSNPSLGGDFFQSCVKMIRQPSVPSPSAVDHDASAFCAGATAIEGLAKMKPTQIAAVLGAAVLLAGAIAPISAQNSKDRTIEQ